MKQKSWLKGIDLKDSELARIRFKQLFDDDFEINLLEKKFSEHSAIYPFATENLAGYFPLLDIRDKSILTVSASGDQIINSHLLKAKEVMSFDSNRLSAFITELKIVGLQRFSYQDYLSFFLKGEDAFHHDAYLSIKNDLTVLCANFWDTAYNFFNNYGASMRSSPLFKNDTTNDNAGSLSSNLYLHSAQSYLQASQNLRKTEWQCQKLEQLSRSLDKKFDVILLSNIADYAEYMYPMYNDHLTAFANFAIKPLKKCLKPNGIICAAYIYNARTSSDKDTWFRSGIDIPKKRKEIFSSLRMDYSELMFKGVIPDQKDAVVILQK